MLYSVPQCLTAHSGPILDVGGVILPLVSPTALISTYCEDLLLFASVSAHDFYSLSAHLDELF